MSHLRCELSFEGVREGRVGNVGFEVVVVEKLFMTPKTRFDISEDPRPTSTTLRSNALKQHIHSPNMTTRSSPKKRDVQ